MTNKMGQHTQITCHEGMSNPTVYKKEDYREQEKIKGQANFLQLNKEMRERKVDILPELAE